MLKRGGSDYPRFYLVERLTDNKHLLHSLRAWLPIASSPHLCCCCATLSFPTTSHLSFQSHSLLSFKYRRSTLFSTMASQANVYQNTSQYFSSYSPRPDSSNEDYKPHYEYDIIDSYATAEIPLPRQPKQTYPSNPTFLKPDSQPRYPPQASKTSLHGAWTSTSDLESSTYDGGGGGGSTGRIMPVVDEKQESRSFWKTVRAKTKPVAFCVDNVMAPGTTRFYSLQAVCPHCAYRDLHRYHN